VRVSGSPLYCTTISTPRNAILAFKRQSGPFERMGKYDEVSVMEATKHLQEWVDTLSHSDEVAELLVFVKYYDGNPETLRTVL
jgi:hypothetical protein